MKKREWERERGRGKKKIVCCEKTNQRQIKNDKINITALTVNFHRRIFRKNLYFKVSIRA